MKKVILFLTVVVIFIISCKRDLSIKILSYPPAASNANPIAGTFAITRFANLNSNGDSTAAFDGYTFSFGADGKMTAVKDNQTVLGGYTETHTLGDNLELAFSFSSKPLSYLNGNWWVKNISDTFIELANASTSDVLEFAVQ